jgi:hypothetical protein
MSKTFIRVKGEGMEVYEFLPEDLQGFQILFEEMIDEYTLTATINDMPMVIQIGTFDLCHSTLNKLHKIINASIIDL